MSSVIGVLALQGAFFKHIEMIEALGGSAVEVRDPSDLAGIRALVMPGGESSTMSRMLLRWELMEPIKAVIAEGLPVFGTCAGLILLADRLVNWNALPRPGGMNIQVERNAYGRQIDSFEASLQLSVPDAPEFDESPFTGVFIRAPRIRPESLGDDVQVLCRFEGAPVLVRCGRILAAAFHPELSGDTRIHRWFLREMVGEV